MQLPVQRDRWHHFHDSHLPLLKWFLATYTMCESKKGVSSNQLKRMLGVSHKTAWYFSHCIRTAMKDASPVPLMGTIEVDETWVGGKKRGVGRGSRENKVMVLGVVQRGGQVRLRVDWRNDRRTLHGFIKANVHDNAERIVTDDWEAYKGIADHNNRHERVNHRAEEWVRTDVHTNTVEGVWSLLKRSIDGSYHQLSAKHPPAYPDEMAFRFNNRKNPYLFRDTMAALLKADTLKYRKLVRETQ